MRNYTIWLLLSGLLLILLSRYLVGTDKGKHIIDSVKISLPLVRRIYVDLYLCSSFRSLGLSLSHGVGIVDALKACSNLAHNVHFQSLIDSMIDNVKEGKGIAYGFQNTDIVPVIAKEMVKTGEDSGSLPLIFKQLATHFEQETNKRIKAFSKSIEPILLLFMGTFIGFLISALILPVFSLSSHIG